MVKHNNIIPNQHFRKWWERHVVTWFDQPAKKQARRNQRIAKSAKIAPRPLDLLRPAVRCPTVKYNSRERLGRGFSLAELKAAGVNKREALNIGIAVDHRRRNRSEESFQANVERLKLYKSKLVIFPRNPTSKRAKQGDATAEERKAVSQISVKKVFSIAKPAKEVELRAITKEEKERYANRIIRKARSDANLWGAREKRAKDKAELEAAKGKKKK